MIIPVETLDIAAWPSEISARAGGQETKSLETGKVLLLPKLGFVVAENEGDLICAASADGTSKNISFDPATGKLRGCALNDDRQSLMAGMIGRFYRQARLLVEALLPPYSAQLRTGMTSYRPLELEGRRSSINEDDSRLHIDAFTSRPIQGLRILRVFSNINPQGKPRIWELGEPFESIAQRFQPRVRPQWPGSAWLLETTHITKGRRSPYDHVMLGVHNAMKHDTQYQTAAPRVRFEFPAGSTWACFSDSVAHAALRGQHLLEQTFYVPVSAMHDERYAPLRVLERLCQRRLS